MVGTVAEALELADTRWAEEEALARLLPKLRASDALLLSAEQRLCICRALANGRPHFVLAALAALEQVGDEAAIPFVERVTIGWAVAARHANVRESAEECLAYLRAGAERERARRSLLRPAEAPADALLRPAQSAGPRAEQMLRPAERERDEG